MKSSISILFVICAIIATLVASEPTRLFSGLVLRVKIASIVDSLQVQEMPNLLTVKNGLESAVANAGGLFKALLEVRKNHFMPFQVDSDGSSSCQQVKSDVERIIPRVQNSPFIEYDVLESCLKAIWYTCDENYTVAKAVIDTSKIAYPSYEEAVVKIESGTSEKNVLHDVYQVHFVQAGTSVRLYPGS
jgi:hypothetical protein